MTPDVTPSETMSPHGLVLPLAGRSTLGGYSLGDIVGRGGMGVVYRGVDCEGQPCAVKVLTPEVTANPDFLQRLQRELTLGPKLSHPHIVDITDVGEEAGLIYLVMPLIEGKNLKEMIEKSPLSLEEAVRLLRPVAEALDHAHEVGVVHCDLKPQNILVQDDPRAAFISDFGLVRPAGAESTASRSREVFGSVQYMAPEQIEGLPVDGRTDVYGLACTMFEALTGRIPFERPNEVAVLWAHVNDELPRLTDVDRRLPGRLDEAVAKGMAKHPDDRYLTCGELISAIDGAMASTRGSLLLPPVRPLVQRKKRLRTEREVWSPNFFPELSRVRAASRERFGWRKAAALVAAVALLSTIQVGRDGGLPQASADVADAAASVVESVTDYEPEPDEVAGEVADKGRPEHKGAGAISAPDRKKLKSLLPTDHSTGAAGTEEPSGGVVDIPLGPGKIAWAKGEIHYGDVDIWVMDPDGSNQIRLTATAWREYYPSWSPDGNHIAYVRIPAGGGPQEIWVMDSDGANQRDLGLCPGNAHCGKLAWSPNGRRVAYAQGSNLYVADLTTGTRRRLVSGGVRPVESPNGDGNPGPTWSPNGKSLAFSCGDLLCLIAARGGDAVITQAVLRDPEWSPAGSWVVGDYWGGYQRGGDIFVTRPDGTDRRQLTHATGPFGAMYPSWAPDGGAVVYCDIQPTEQAFLFRINLDGSGLVQLTSGPLDFTPDWWGPSL